MHTDQWKSSFQTDHRNIRPKLYMVWSNMRARCLNPKNPSYKWYGKRGINICQEWDIFGRFRQWALANGYAPGLVIDRTNNDLGYSPENCRWITHLQNQPDLKLTEDDVRAIREFKGSHTEVAAKFGVHYTQAWGIRIGRKRTDVV